MTNMSTRDLTLIAVFAAVTAVLAYVYIPLPFSPVPITGQTMGVMLAGALLGPKKGAMSQVVYLLLGVVGLPVFAGGYGGLSHLFGPTGGYLLACPIAAYVTGYFVQMGEKSGKQGQVLLSFVGLITGGMVIIYSLGVAQLVLVTGLPLREGLATGALPYLIGDFAKVAGTYFLIRGVYASPVKTKILMRS